MQHEVLGISTYLPVEILCRIFDWSVMSGRCELSTCGTRFIFLVTRFWRSLQYHEVFLAPVYKSPFWCPRHYEFRNYSGVACWYMHWQLVSGQFEYITLQYKCFHHWVLARNDVSFDRFPDLVPSKNILVSTPLWVQELQWSGLLVYAFAIGFLTVWVCPTSIQVLPSLSIG